MWSRGSGDKGVWLRMFVPEEEGSEILGEEKGERIVFQGSLQGKVSGGFKSLPFFEVRVKFVRITAGQYMNYNEKQVAGKDRSE